MRIMSGYQISDEDVEATVRYMKIYHPEKSDPDYCRQMLEAFQAGLIAGLREIAISKPDDIEVLFEQYESYLKSA